MPIGVALDVLRKELRAETGQALNYTLHGVQSQDTQDIMLDRQQRELWDAYDWPHLRYWSDIPLANGQYLYSYPLSTPFDQITRICVAQTTASSWKPLAYGLRAFDILAAGPQRGTPNRWGNNVTVTSGLTSPDGQISLYPIPNVDGMIMRIEGQAPCTTLAVPTDRCIIDSKAIVLFCAAEILAVQKSESAALKLTKAQNYLRKLLVNNGADKRGNFNMGGNGRVDHLALRPYANVPGIGYIP